MPWYQRYKSFLIGLAISVAAVVLAALAGRRLTGQELRAALAKRRLEDTTKALELAEAKAAQLKTQGEALAEQLLTEELILAAKKKEANAMDPGAVIVDLQSRRLIKRKP